MLDKPPADLADAFHSDPAATQFGAAPHVLRGRAHALEHTESGEHRRVARPAMGDGPAGDVGALAGNDVHVFAVGSDGARRDVATAERPNEPAICAQKLL